MIITKLVVVIIKECVEKAREKTCRRRRKVARSVLTLNNVLIGSKRFIMSDNDDEG